MKIAMCASEVVPFAKTGGLADVAGALPLALERLKQEVIIVMPYYKKASLTKFEAKPLFPGILTGKTGKDIKAYFIQNDKYFDREGLYGDKQGDYPDNIERFSFYSRRCLELLKQIQFKPEVIHVHDWQASLIPIYLKAAYSGDSFYRDTRTLLTIHNLAYQGTFSREEFPKLGLDWSLFNMEQLEFYGKVNILKGGIVFSDSISTVSSTYAAEIQTKEFGCGLEGVLTARKNVLFGILNGLDYSAWNPATDKFIFHKYGEWNLKGKYKNKEGLQRDCKLPVDREVPLLGVVSRLAEQKGLDILVEALADICRLGVQVIILGTGDIKYHKLLEEKSRKFKKSLRLFLKFDNTLAHRIYAGSDIFLMPSRFEPCGLGQMISLKYATVPLVFKTGGLADTIDKSNGFVFDNYSASALIETVKEAAALYKDKKKWQAKIKRGMKANFSWRESAKKYIELYNKLIAK